MICLYAGSLRQESVIFESAAGGAKTQAFTGKEVDPSVDDAGARESVSAMTFSFPATHLTLNG